ncbi:MAG TPA: hypothetical protein ENI23_14240 [bacterium]|nr:hypothetical protein [bacterium]
MSYGTELVIDLHECKTVATREVIKDFMRELCDLIDMERADLFFWDYDDLEEQAAAPDHLSGISAVQFITTSNVTIHTLDRLKSVYLNIFTCKKLKAAEALEFCEEFWGGKAVSNTILVRT